MLSTNENTKFCWICGKDVVPAQCMTDEYCLSVHKTCHETRALLKAASLQTDVSRQVQREAA